MPKASKNYWGSSSWADLFLHFCGFPLQTTAFKQLFLCARLLHSEELSLLIHQVYISGVASFNRSLARSILHAMVSLKVQRLRRLQHIVFGTSAVFPSQTFTRWWLPLRARSQNFKLESGVVSPIIYLLLGLIKLAENQGNSYFLFDYFPTIYPHIY